MGQSDLIRVVLLLLARVPERRRAFYLAPAVRGKGWLPNLVWRPATRDHSSGTPDRAGFIERSIARGGLSLLNFREYPF